MKICIITQPLYTNYGGLLQAFALQKVLKDMGNEVVTDRYAAKPPMSFLMRVVHFAYHLLKRYIIRDKQYNPYQFLFTCFDEYSKKKKALGLNTGRFINQHIATIDFFHGKSKPSMEMLSQFDAIVVGSDQVWRALYSYTPSYFLDFTKGIDIKRISYATSFGKDDVNEYSSSILKKCKDAAPLFDAISVREDLGVTLCKEYFGVEAIHVLDPTILLEQEDYLEIIEEEDKEERSNVLMCYVLDKSEEKRAIINQFATRLNLSPLEVMPKKNFDASVTGDLTDYIFPSVSKWIAGFRDAEFVVTDSFHGTVFSIIFNKPFIAIANAERGASRFTSLLKIFGLEHRLVSSINEITDAHFSPIDFEQVNKTKRIWQMKAVEFLNNGLK